MSHNLLALANAANEAGLAYRGAREDMRLNHWPALIAADGLAGAVDELTAAVVERANEAPIEIPLGDLTRLREVEEVAARLGKSVPEAIVWLVNDRLSGSFHDGYRAAIEEHGIVETPPAVPGDGYCQDEPERDGGTTLPEAELVDIRASARAMAGRFVDPAIVASCGKVLDRRGETWAASILGRDISKRSPARNALGGRRPWLNKGEEYVLVFADQAEDARALERLEP
jgi:hypothetical protein